MQKIGPNEDGKSAVASPDERSRKTKAYLKIHEMVLFVLQQPRICVYYCHNQPKVGNDFFELISSSDAAEKELSSKSKIVFL